MGKIRRLREWNQKTNKLNEKMKKKRMDSDEKTGKEMVVKKRKEEREK